MKRIGIDISPRQHSRLRNGHTVRVKKGDGLILLVHPERFDIMTKTFNRGKAREISLTAEELMANRKISPEAHQETQKIEEYNSPKDLKPESKTIPTITGGHISNVGGTRDLRIKTMSGMKDAKNHLENLGNYTGEDYGYQMRAGLGNVEQNRATNEMIQMGLMTARQNRLIPPKKEVRGRGMKETSSVNVGGNLLSQRGLPQALQSQPYGANFQFQHFLPPSYAKYNGGH